MADPFVAEIRIFPFNFAPRGWAWCDGQIVPIAQNTALFALLGTTYGGNGRDNFALPNLQGRSPLKSGRGPGLSDRDLGQRGGLETVTLLASEVPSHSHSLRATSAADTGAPAGAALANVASGAKAYRVPGATTSMAADVMAPVGGSPHNNRQPYLTCYFAIALQGVFPPRA